MKLRVPKIRADWTYRNGLPAIEMSYRLGGRFAITVLGGGDSALEKGVARMWRALVKQSLAQQATGIPDGREAFKRLSKSTKKTEAVFAALAKWSAGR